MSKLFVSVAREKLGVSLIYRQKGQTIKPTMATYLSYLQQYHEKEFAFLYFIVKRERGASILSTRANDKTKYELSSASKKSKVVFTMSGKVFLRLLIEYLERGTITNAQRYADSLEKLRQSPWNHWFQLDQEIYEWMGLWIC